MKKKNLTIKKSTISKLNISHNNKEGRTYTNQTIVSSCI
jgi:hypothetical protein